ncbi:hypothetical protein MVEN_00181500 [Mycena venus]|uniref:Uncharacterized protein n=1 Tax=Mycena venus TaxID=2733690 RepID=A0A8H6YWW2_9AGAR|nr:hypothetical protein MVEN_00181500 [Mycena venus]
MRTTILTIAVALAVAATSTAARNCKYGVTYCGSTLQRIGNYDTEIQSISRSRGLSGAGDSILFRCSTILGNVEYAGYCGGGKCMDGGQGNSDYCQQD